ncbi:Uncharacterized protein GBIM_07586 [Gryllus bimaculatus]|nr:Uncharacterized protein GBIM_07586 [Gryllus bimaculatus]
MNLAAEAGLLNGGLPEVCYPPSVVGLTVETNGIAKSQSPVTEFIADEEAASVCPLLSPSPPTDFEHPLALPSVMGYDHQISPSSTDPELSALPTVNGNAITNLDVDRHSTGGAPEGFNPTSSVQSMIESSSSSGSSVLHESAACAQLLSNHHYQHLTKASDGDPFTLQENGGKPVLTGIQLAVRKSTDDHCFLDWNWPLIRKISFWTVISLLMACMCVVVGMVAQLPSRCDPPHAWWQGTLFYEIFPASFQDKNSDGIGDLIGLSSRANYLEALGVKAVRLNSIFASDDYPDHFDHVKNLMKVDHHLGTIKDFQKMVGILHDRNISVILDLPLKLFKEQLGNEELVISLPRRDNRVLNDEDFKENPENKDKLNTYPTLASDSVTESPYREERVPPNMISEALQFWLNMEVDGFYLKDLEHITFHSSFAPYVREWRKIIDNYSQGMQSQKILMCNINVLNSLNVEDDLEKINVVLNHMDLVDVHLDLYSNGTEGIKRSVNNLLKGLLYEKPGYPWIHWNVGSVETHRLAAVSGSAEGNLAAVLFNMMLPGTPSIFYGDEIGLQDYFVPDGEHREIHHPSQLAPMHWNSNEHGFGFTSTGIFPWINPSQSLGSVVGSRKDIIRNVAMFRESSPSIYMNGIVKEGMKTPNCEIRVLDSDIVVIQRWYPRRHSYVMVTNLGGHTRTRDLSSWLYGGEIVVDQRSRTGQYVKFDSLTLNAQESLIVKLDK